MTRLADNRGFGSWADGFRFSDINTSLTLTSSLGYASYGFGSLGDLDDIFYGISLTKFGGFGLVPSKGQALDNRASNLATLFDGGRGNDSYIYTLGDGTTLFMTYKDKRTYNLMVLTLR